MTMKRICGWIAAALLLAACGAGAGDAGAEDGTDPRQAVPASASEPAISLPTPPVEEQPTAEDSAAAARDSVSPEWKQRERSMASYPECMRQARGADDPMRSRLEEACGRLHDAPR